MITLDEASRGMYGAYRLARGDERGMAYFDTSIQGFWRSFYAAALVAPLYLVFLGVRFQAGHVDVPVWRYFSIHSVAYVIAWVAFPLLMVSLVRALERDEQYVPYIVAYNWASVWQNALYMPFLILADFRLLPMGLAQPLNFAILALVLIYVWFITRTALVLGPLTAVGLVAVDFLLGLFINVVARIMLLSG
jgi:hypothetical protein